MPSPEHLPNGRMIHHGGGGKTGRKAQTCRCCGEYYYEESAGWCPGCRSRPICNQKGRCGAHCGCVACEAGILVRIDRRVRDEMRAVGA